jgi:hypothetical protein
MVRRKLQRRFEPGYPVILGKGETEMARTNTQITPAEAQAYGLFCIEHGIVVNDGSKEDEQNADFILNYFVNVWKEDITEQNLDTAWDQIRPHLKMRSPAQAEYYKVATQENDRANQLAAWLATQGKPGQLANQGEAAFDNLRLLLLTLRGYEISPPRIRDAEDRIAHKPGKKLQYVPQPRRTEPISPAAKNDDGKPFLGDTAERLNEPGWVKRSRERSEREAKEAANQPSSASVRSRAAAEAREKAESLQSSTHAETDQLRRIFVTSGTEIDWVQTLAARLQMQKQFDKAREVRRFVR